jgi:thymidylate kinase
MKLIIVEGMDRTGKDTIIQSLYNQYHNLGVEFTSKHFKKPKNKGFLGLSEQIKTFNNAFLEDYEKRDQPGVIVYNRSYLGECVYGPLYRNINREYFEWVWTLDKIYTDSFDDISLIILDASPEALLKIDDGKGFWKTIENIKNERALFLEIFSKSSIGRKILLPTFDEMGKRIDKNELFKVIFNFINLNQSYVKHK